MAASAHLVYATPQRAPRPYYVLRRDARGRTVRVLIRPPPPHPVLQRPPVPVPVAPTLVAQRSLTSAELAAGVARLLPEARTQGVGQVMQLSAGPTYGSFNESVPPEAIAQFLGQGYTLINTRGEPYS